MTLNSNNNNHNIHHNKRNVGILEKIVQSLGATSSITNMNPRGNHNSSSSSWNETIAQYEAQTHVLQQLEEKLKVLLHLQQSTPPPPPLPANNQTAMMKLQRDFERVQLRVQQLQDMAATKISSIQQQSKMTTSSIATNSSSSSTMPFFFNTNHPTGEENDTPVLRQYQQQQLMLQQEDRLQEEIMREREEEIRNINRGMHTVNEIYKDLAHIVSQQQHDIDTIETQMDQAHTSAQQGLQQVEKANEKYGQGNCVVM